MGTKTKEIAKRSSKYLEEALYKRLFRSGISPQSVRSELETFLKSRKRVFKWEVGVTVRKLRDHKRFKTALKLYEIMEKRGMNPTIPDLAIRLDLISKTRGIQAAEEFFMNLPEASKSHLTYGPLLNSYCKELLTDKAEALFEKMKELNFAQTAMSYNSLMTLYTKTNNHEKVPKIIQEMKNNDVLPDCFTYNVWMRSLAAMGDVSGVDRILEEMKRDGRVAPDWTTYSNLASIYADAGLFQKAEMALKELEKRNTSNDIVGYQFLITLYGRTGNLVELHRLWRSLKLKYPQRMANMSYLNMIQVLTNLKDLTGAEAIFKEWELKCKDYDIRIANAMIKAYIKEGNFDQADCIKKHAKMRGGRPNAKTWELFMEYYLEKGDLKMAHWCADRAIKKGRSLGRPWVPSRDVVVTLIGFFEGIKNVGGAEKFVNLLKTLGMNLEKEVFEALIKVYVSAGKKCPAMKNRLKVENVAVCEEVQKLLDSICD
ncbi:tetratricopeptide repeat (TPR)-like superfamily protein [Carex rostrata]